MALQQLLRLAKENDDYDLIYVLLINEQIPRCVSYDRAWPRFNIDTLTDDQCWINFRYVWQRFRRLHFPFFNGVVFSKCLYEVVILP